VTCSWCGAVIRYGDVAQSHGICASCSNELVGMSTLSAEALDALPYGAIGLDEEGIVRSYNRREEERSRLRREDVIGQSFFWSVAPCARIHAFWDRYLAFCADPASAPVTFRFRFDFPHGREEVEIRFVHGKRTGDPLAEVAVWVFVTAARPDGSPAA